MYKVGGKFHIHILNEFGIPRKLTA